MPSALSLPFHYPSYKDKFFILNRRIQWLLFRMLHLWISRLLSCLFCRIILSLLDIHCCRVYLFHCKSLCKRLQFRLHKLYFLCRWQVILLCDCISFWCNCIKIVHLCFRKIKKTHAYRVIYSLILWMATRLSLKILLFTNVGFELYFNNFFHQLWVWYLPFCECFPLFCRIRCHS